MTDEDVPQSVHGAGDRWLAGERVPGVTFMHHQEVELASGSREGERGRVLLLLTISPEPIYLVAMHGGAGELRVRQSSLRAATPA